MPPSKSPSPSQSTPPPASSPQTTTPITIATPALKDKRLRMSYRIGRGEQGVLTFEPYKSHLLPHWRFRTPSIARHSCSTLFSKFEAYVAAGDFVGADMARKFMQMGMTRAKRYANHKGGRKYDRKSGQELERSTGHVGAGEKEEASRVFRERWEACRTCGEYLRLKGEFQKELKEWDGAGGDGDDRADGVA